MSGRRILLPLMLAAVAVSCIAAARATPLPEWFVAVLGVVLPWVFATFISRLPAWSRAPTCYAVSAAVAIAAGFAWCGWRSAGDIIRNVVWLWATMLFVYDLFVRRAVPALRDKASKNAEAVKLRRIP